MASMGEVEAEDGVSGLEDGHVGGGVGLRAGVRLHVGMFSPEDLLRSVASEVLDDVGEFASAVVAATGVALGVFVGEDRTGGFKNSLADEVFRGDYLQPLVLAEDFVFDGGGDFGISLGKRQGHAVGHRSIVGSRIALNKSRRARGRLTGLPASRVIPTAPSPVADGTGSRKSGER